tara:strand:+ start:231 stop:566 length:336 start_codon:yes stop_codon:yes gene_type:complete
MKNLFLRKKNRLAFIFCVNLFFSFNGLMAKANYFIDDQMINILVNSCYKDISACKEVLSKINNYQKKAAGNKKFSCQTRLLGLEANILMVMNYNFKAKEAKSIINDVRKYC